MDALCLYINFECVYRQKRYYDFTTSKNYFNSCDDFIVAKILLDLRLCQVINKRGKSNKKKFSMSTKKKWLNYWKKKKENKLLFYFTISANDPLSYKA